MRTLLSSTPLLQAGELEIVGQEAHHGLTVLRLRPGERLRMADGKGRAAAAEVLSAGHGGLRLRLGPPETVPDPPTALLTVACAIPKGGRFEDLVRSLSELGEGRLRPLLCERGERLPRSLDRARRVAEEALKQCRRGRLLELGPETGIPSLVQEGVRLTVLDRAGIPARPGPPGAITLVVGPEGGLTPEELDQLRSAGAGFVRLAAPVLRIETAALAAAAVWAAAWEHP